MFIKSYFSKKGCVCVLVYTVHIDSQARKETVSTKGNQEGESTSVKKPRAQERQRKSANAEGRTQKRKM